MVLERYGDDVIRAVTSPLTGIQRTCKFPPSIAEFVEFIDDHIRRSNYAQEYDARSREQLREREQRDRDARLETPEHRKAVVERGKAEMRAKSFKFADDRRAPEDTPERVRAKYGLTAEQWDALPDRPDTWRQVGGAQ
jgi:hypothetical protein